MSYSCKCCVLVEVSGAGLSLVQGSSTEFVVFLSVIDEPRRGGLGPIRLSCRESKNTLFANSHIVYYFFKVKNQY